MQENIVILDIKRFNELQEFEKAFLNNGIIYHVKFHFPTSHEKVYISLTKEKVMEEYANKVFEAEQYKQQGREEEINKCTLAKAILQDEITALKCSRDLAIRGRDEKVNEIRFLNRRNWFQRLLNIQYKSKG